MQTFLPYPSFEVSAKVLDSARLNKQITECKQILDALDGKPCRWINHPAVQMWQGYKDTLVVYGNSMYTEWLNRGKNLHKAGEEIRSRYVVPTELVWWLGVGNFHLSHQSRLMHKGKVDLLRTRINKKKLKELSTLYGTPKEWYKITPSQLEKLNTVLDKIGCKEATGTNHYHFYIDSKRCYLWPTEDHQFKYRDKDGWKIFDGHGLPYEW